LIYTAYKTAVGRMHMKLQNLY